MWVYNKPSRPWKFAINCLNWANKMQIDSKKKTREGALFVYGKRWGWGRNFGLEKGNKCDQKANEIKILSKGNMEIFKDFALDLKIWSLIYELPNKILKS